ncbi:MAG TPA: hypothetical protein VFU40_13570 [Gemmatimonadales bacterium]|nr:hypothetical protein [Gemmatimonadales bacterium]
MQGRGWRHQRANKKQAGKADSDTNQQRDVTQIEIFVVAVQQA